MLITCQDAAFGYDGHIVVSELNFSVNSGDYLCIAGENGSGKSTLIKGMLRLISPLKGSVKIDEGIRRDETGYLSQQAAAKNDFPAGVAEIVLSGSTGAMGLRPFYSRGEKRRAEENMERLSITDLRKRCYRELSGGQQRRVLVARALCAARKLLVLDEPAAGLDPLIAAELYALLKKTNQETGITIIMVSHDVRTAGIYANKVLHVKNRQCFFGGTADYMNSGIGKEFCGGGKGGEDER
ncbi:MAG: ATP-binding cassette domain-containing protein [Treponema sp.]|jgi:zinc transport system ATP-binding protein|nr:ATP-binding cassette domain-containing protein [Treponema sp.]